MSVRSHETRKRKPMKVEKNKIKDYLFLVLAVLAIVTVSCRSKHAVLEGEPSATAFEPWTSVYASVNVDVDRPMSLGASGRTTMVKEEYVHVSMRFLGMEVAVLYLDTDSVYFVDKFHKYLFAEPLSTVLGARYQNLTLGDVQNMILGREKVPDAEGVEVKATDYVETVAGAVASNLSIKAERPQFDIDATLNWKPATATWNDTSRKVSFKVPSNYTRITIDNLMRMLKSMSF